MGRRRVQVVLVCEDSQHESFMLALLSRAGFDRRGVDVRRGRAGRGSAEAFVRRQFVVEVGAHRRVAHRMNNALVAVIDADQYTLVERHSQLDSALRVAGLDPRRADERVAVLVPKRNIETWIHYLRDEPVDEEQAYRKLRRPSDCKPQAQRMAEMLDDPPSEAPPSFRDGCQEMTRIRGR